MDDGSAEETSAIELMQVLEKHRIQCEQEGRYEEAELARTRLEQLKQHEEITRRKALIDQQIAEKMGVEEAHVADMKEFNDIWEQKTSEFENHAFTLRQTLAQRHLEEHQKYLEKLRQSTEPKTPRWSKDLLNLRKIQETLAKMKKYAEAEKTKIQADNKEAEEHQEWKVKREAKIAALDEHFLHKQQLEMGGLLKRITMIREEQKHAREAELNRILQRYHNVKMQMDSQQRIIQQRVERYPIMAPLNASMNRPDSRGTSMKY